MLHPLELRRRQSRHMASPPEECSTLYTGYSSEEGEPSRAGRGKQLCDRQPRARVYVRVLLTRHERLCFMYRHSTATADAITVVFGAHGQRVLRLLTPQGS